ncbi:MAG: nucleotidyltransferase domain-containing protein [Chloroflexi bacterium]|nr:nucleotidyltransferase domain-containing protein [Chloroflexota bacterium]
MVDESIVKIVRQYLQSLIERGIPIQCGVIFGSQASGQPDTWSDIDLLVVSPRFDGERKRADVNLLWHVAARIDSRIEPIPVGQRQFEEDDRSAIIEIARRQGQKMFPEDKAFTPEGVEFA